MSGRGGLAFALGVLTTSAAALLGCHSAGHEASWSLRFADPSVADRAVLVEALVFEGACDGPVLYRADVPPDGPGPMPPVLSPGTYGLAAVARDASCRTVAEGCVELELPPSPGVEPNITLEAVDRGPACPEDRCAAGRCDDDVPPVIARGDAGGGSADAGWPGSDAGDGCDARLDGRCYRIRGAPRAWDQAETDCAGWGGHLVRIDDRDEERALVDVGAADAHWIGLTDASEEGAFAWSDGSPLTYARWADGAPRAMPPWRDCVHTTEDGWTDARCSDALPYVCER